MEWAHAIAPAAGILVVEAQSDTLSDLMKAVNVARNTPGVAAVSMSWGFSESIRRDRVRSPRSGLRPATRASRSSPPAGITARRPAPNIPRPRRMSWRSAARRWLLDDAGDYVGETRLVRQRRRLQPLRARAGLPDDRSRSTGHRSTPDVAFDADPGTGVEVYQTPPRQPPSGPGSPSAAPAWASPAWAAIIAIVDQGRALAGQGQPRRPDPDPPSPLQPAPTDFNTVSMPPPYSPWGGGVNPIGYTPFRRRLPPAQGPYARPFPNPACPGRQHRHRPRLPGRPALIARPGGQQLEAAHFVDRRPFQSRGADRFSFGAACDPRLQGSPLNDAGLER